MLGSPTLEQSTIILITLAGRKSTRRTKKIGAWSVVRPSPRHALDLLPPQLEDLRTGGGVWLTPTPRKRRIIIFGAEKKHRSRKFAEQNETPINSFFWNHLSICLWIWFLYCDSKLIEMHKKQGNQVRSHINHTSTFGNVFLEIRILFALILHIKLCVCSFLTFRVKQMSLLNPGEEGQRGVRDNSPPHLSPTSAKMPFPEVPATAGPYGKWLWPFWGQEDPT